MRKLTDNQKEFILQFFKHGEYAGSRFIAIKLIDTGQCIVAGTECIWRGGIGNFIKTSPAENTVECSLYEFDLEYFLRSEWFKEVQSEAVVRLGSELRMLKDEFEDICDL